jgi:hypothetical protein
MSTQNQSIPPVQRPAQQPRKPYQKPALRSEHVFETLALRCGKVSVTQASCAQVPRAS